ncbi:MAG: FmdB family zinc ribbon protein [Blastocatellia bacterium]
MPIYEYVCEKCGSHLEVMQKVSDAPLKRCEKCRGKLEKIFSRTSFQLKGGGWYVTDYPGKSTPKSDKSDKAEKSPKSEKSSKKAESATSAD